MLFSHIFYFLVLSLFLFQQLDHKRQGYIIMGDYAAARHSGLRHFSRYDQLDVSRVVTSNLISPKALFSLRVFFSLYLLVTLTVTIMNVVNGHHLPHFLYSSQFVNSLVSALYFMAATWHTFKYIRTKSLSPLTDQHWILTVLHWILYSGITVGQVGVIIKATINGEWAGSGFLFAGPTVCVLIEMLFSRMNMVSTHSLVVWTIFEAYLSIGHAARLDYDLDYIYWGTRLSPLWHTVLFACIMIAFQVLRTIHFICNMDEGDRSQTRGSLSSSPNSVDVETVVVEHNPGKIDTQTGHESLEGKISFDAMMEGKIPVGDNDDNINETSTNQ